MEVIGDLRLEQNAVADTLQAYERGPADEKLLNIALRSLQSYKESAAAHEAAGDLEAARRAHWKVKNQEMRLKMYRMKDPAERSGFKEELELRDKDLNKQIKKLSGPFNRQFRAVIQEYEQLSNFPSYLKDFIHNPAKMEMPVRLNRINYSGVNPFASVTWEGPDGIRAFYATFEFLPKEADPKVEGLFLGKYPYTKWTDYGMSVYVGEMAIHYSTKLERYKSKEGLGEALPLLFDLEGLANLKPKARPESPAE
ncbi:hypothetical protein DDZ13_04260 [Coraliomargarita sinensis]|uniref:Uncharacterized protein n=2 Tax=Coraliomargarita sinensis TaxID=2174842 RepID=A0A317ZP90_9BACT|nr:hypothetical protein DDZ13_04260 [Coraliomargarita sinensis]